MSLYNIVGSASLQAGQPEDISQVLANLQAIQTILNGGIDDANVRTTAAIQLSKLAGYPTDAAKFAAGDGTWADSVRLITDAAANGVNSVTFSSIPQIYKHLMMLWKVEAPGGSGAGALGMTFNGTVTGYYTQRLGGSGSTASASSGQSVTRMQAGDVPDVGLPAVGVTFFPNYTDGLQMSLVSLSMAIWGTALGQMEVLVDGGLSGSNGPINSINCFTADTRNFSSSRFSLYGVG